MSLRADSVAAESLRRRGDRKSTRLNSSHSQISYAVFCLKKKKMSLSGSLKDNRPLEDVLILLLDDHPAIRLLLSLQRLRWGAGGKTSASAMHALLPLTL